MARTYPALCVAVLLGVLSTACSKNEATPTTPTAPAATVTAVTVTSATPSSGVTIRGTLQLVATARMSDATTRDITSQAQWESSSTALATVSSTGLVTVVSGGDVDIRATYLGVVGALHLIVALPAPPTTFELAGVVTEAAPVSKILGGVPLVLTNAAGVMTTVMSDPGGLFRFPAVAAGVVSIEATRDGYLPWRVSNLTVDQDYRQLEVVLFPVPPTDATGTKATARCNDATWSYSASRADACSANGGIAYTVCPGLLCNTSTAPARR